MSRRQNLGSAIDTVEVVYDLVPEGNDWFDRVVDTIGQVVDHDMGLVGSHMTGQTPDGIPMVARAHVSGADQQLPLGFLGASHEIGQEEMARIVLAMAGRTFAIAELEDDFPDATASYRKHLGCEDVLIMSAIDPNVFGFSLNFVSSKRFNLNASQRDLLAKLSVHMAAGDRLRRGLDPAAAAPRGLTLDEIRDAAHIDAILDPKQFEVADARGEAVSSEARDQIRAAAKSVDRARGKLRKTDPEEALEIWQGLVRGRWSLVDWFDTDGRRFVLARPNAPDLGDPRGLTERELQVVTYAAQGESGKLIGYRFGLSQGHVSTLLKSGMRKLGVKTEHFIGVGVGRVDDACPAGAEGEPRDASSGDERRVEFLKVGAVQVHAIELDHFIGVGVGAVDDARSVGADGKVLEDFSFGDERRVEFSKVGAVQVHAIELDHFIGVGVGRVDDACPVGADGEPRDFSSGNQRLGNPVGWLRTVRRHDKQAHVRDPIHDLLDPCRHPLSLLKTPSSAQSLTFRRFADACRDKDD